MRHIALSIMVLAILEATPSCQNHKFSETAGVPSENPAAFLSTDAQKATAATLRDIKDGHLYTIDYTADYKIDELMAGGGAVQHDPERSNIMASLAIRLSLDGCATVDEALEVFRSHNFFADGEDSPNNYHFLIADASGRSVVVEYYRPGEEAPVEDAAAKDWTLNVLEEDHVTNFYLTDGWQNLGVGQARYDIIHERLEEKNRILTEDEAMQLLQDVLQLLNPEEITSNTQWSVVYNLTRKTATVCVDKDYETRLNFRLQ